MPLPPSESTRPVATPPSPKRPKATQSHKSIADVSEAVIRGAVTEVLVQAGGTDPKDLTRSVARRLGFERTGKNIERRITDVIEDMVRSGQLAAAADNSNVRVASGKS
jgi:hypothetical protein